jgi:hypothetical protein
VTPLRFIPFEAMSVGEREAHIQTMHGCLGMHLSTSELAWCHKTRLPDREFTPHTHDKPARTRTEETQ